MLYESNTTEKSINVCGQEEIHNMKQEQLAGECQNMQLETTTIYQNKEVHVILEFPTQSDPKAEQEFISRLKEIYLRKIENGAIQKKDSALESNPDVNAVDKNNKSVYDSTHTKEEEKNE